MFFNPRRIEYPLDLSVQCPQHASARHHGRAVEFDDQEQGFYRGLPRIKILLGLRQAGDVVAGIAQSQDRIIEGTSPRGNGLQLCDQLSAFRNVLNVQFTFSSAGPGCRDLWADCSAFLSCSRSSFNSEI
jgi:hypothetical protein